MVIKKFLLPTVGCLKTSKIDSFMSKLKSTLLDLSLEGSIKFLFNCSFAPKIKFISRFIEFSFKFLSLSKSFFSSVKFPTIEKGHFSLSQIFSNFLISFSSIARTYLS